MQQIFTHNDPCFKSLSEPRLLRSLTPLAYAVKSPVFTCNFVFIVTPEFEIYDSKCLSTVSVDLIFAWE